MTFMEIVNSPELTDIVVSSPVSRQEGIALQLLAVARRLTGTDTADAVETQARLEQIQNELPSILRELVRIGGLLRDEAKTACHDGSVGALQKAWGIVPAPKPARQKDSVLDVPDELDRIALLKFVQDALPGDIQAQRQIYGRVLREASEMSPDGLMEECRNRVGELVREHRRLNYSKEESWFFGRKRKGDLPSREEFLKRMPIAGSHLLCVERSDGHAFYSLRNINPKCTAMLAVPIEDEAVINRLDRAHIILKPSRSKISKWRVAFLYRWHGRTSRLETEVPLETVIPKYKIIDGDTVTEFTAVDLEQKQANRVAKALRNPLCIGTAAHLDWMVRGEQ